MTTDEQSAIYIVDDDESVRKALSRLFRSSRRPAIALSCVEDLLRHAALENAACIVADLRLPGASGLTIPKALRQLGFDVPVIIVTAHDTEQVREEARRAGVVAFFHKPVDDQALLDSIDWAVEGASKKPH